eukprot:4854380-Ditylum_brightwellii.AAC.1
MNSRNEISLKTTHRRFKWKVDHERSALCENFERREGWTHTDDDDWNVYWASVSTVHALFNPEKGKRLADDQFVCHFPNHYELTRKDLMVRNIKRYTKDLQRQRKSSCQCPTKRVGDYDKGMKCNCDCEWHCIDHADFEFIPNSYLLPADYS